MTAQLVVILLFWAAEVQQGGSWEGTFHGAGLIFCMNHMGSGFGVHFLGTYLSLSRADPTETWKFCQILFPFSRVTHQAGSWEALFLKQYALLQLHLATLCCQPGV